jgi:hypothetical protein
MNPYFHDRLWPAVLGNLELLYGTLLDGREWSWTFIPEGYRYVAIAALPALWLAGELKGARAHAAFLCVVGLGMLAPTTYETFLVNRLRYLWPFSAPWLLGLAALGHLLGVALARWQPRLVLVGLAIPVVSGVAFAKLAPISVADLAQSAAAISAQQVELGRWAARSLPEGAKLGVNDAGAIAFFSGKPTFDVVGLTTRGEAPFWVAGAGSRFEHYERLKRSELPTHFIVYPGWFALPSLLGTCLTERRVDGATILGGSVMVACVADYTSLGSGKLPISVLTTGTLLDEVDVADLESEAAHGYALGWTNAQDDVVVQDVDVVDGGRARRLADSFWLRVQGGGSLVLRFGAEQAGELRIHVDGVALEPLSVTRGPFQEQRVALPTALGHRPRAAVTMSSPAPLTLLHYWSFGPG